MHAKRKGNIGQSATAHCLARFGFSVFIEAGDISKIDVIAEHDGLILTFQCKAVTSADGKIVVPLRKCGPNYRYCYSEKLFNFFAVYDLTDGQLYLLPGDILRERRNTFILRKVVSKNNQSKGVHPADDYLAERILRDYTGDTRPDRLRVVI